MDFALLELGADDVPGQGLCGRYVRRGSDLYYAVGEEFTETDPAKEVRWLRRYADLGRSPCDWSRGQVQLATAAAIARAFGLDQPVPRKRKAVPAGTA